MDLSTQRKTEEIKKSLNEIIDNYDKVKPYYAFSYKVLSFDTLCLTLSYKVNGLANKLYKQADPKAVRLALMDVCSYAIFVLEKTSKENKDFKELANRAYQEIKERSEETEHMWDDWQTINFVEWAIAKSGRIRNITKGGMTDEFATKCKEDSVMDIFGYCLLAMAEQNTP